MGNRQRFSTWLRDQNNRDDPVGDLARDLQRDRRWPRSATRIATLDRHLRSMGACTGARDALVRAWNEWQGDTSMPGTWRPKVLPDVAPEITRRLLAGESCAHLCRDYDRSAQWVSSVAKAAGLDYDITNGLWYRTEQEQAPMTTDAWNMTTEDYTALVTPEREQTNGKIEAIARLAVRPAGTEHFDSYDTDSAAAFAEAAPEQEHDITSTEDSDIMTAVKLLDMAEVQRSKDIAEIERLELALSDVRGQNEHIAAAHAKELQAAESRITRLETEIRRLDNALKVEISKNARLEERGLLRQSIDRLSKVL